jgi:hypothetical protein
MEIRSNDGVEALRLQHHAASHGIDQHTVDRNVWEVLGDLGGDLVPHDHSESLGVGLGDDGQELSWTLLCSLESESDESFDAMTGENGDFSAGFPWEAAVGAAALTSVFSFAVLSNDHPVEISG